MEDLLVFSVFEITQHLKQVIETQIDALYVRGEVSNYTRHSSGHIYFNLKDANATLRCTFFRFANLTLDFEPEEGMEVICFGKLTVYEKGGSYSLNVQTMALAGKGDLARQFELLKVKLQQEGLFEQAHKKSLPRYPQRIGIITSPTGAALQDIINVLSRRFPIEIDVYPALVQGSEAPAQLIDGLKYFNDSGNVDVIILTRGGGSQEDLFCFNDEALAREIFASVIPVISAVGHEIDFTIADFVADLRAPTPSAAAEIVVPDRGDLLSYLSSLSQGLKTALSTKIVSSKNQLSDLRYKLSRFHPEKVWQGLQLRLDMAEMEMIRSGSRLQSALHKAELRQTIALNSMQNIFKDAMHISKQRLRDKQFQLQSEANSRIKDIRNDTEKIGIRLESYSPFAILGRGYSFLQRKNKPLSTIKDLTIGEELQLTMRDGSADIRIQNIKPSRKENATD